MLLGAEFGDEALETLIGELRPDRLCNLNSGKHCSFKDIEGVA